MILLILSAAGLLSCQVPSADSVRPYLRVAVAVVGPIKGPEQPIHEALEIETTRALAKSRYQVIRSSPPLLWDVLSDMRVLGDTAVLHDLDPARKHLRLDVLIAAYVIKSESSHVVLGGAVYTGSSTEQSGARFVGSGTTLADAVRNLADVVAADLRRRASAREPRRRGN